MPENSFTAEDLADHWKSYYESKLAKREHNIASLFQLDTARILSKNQIEYSVPSPLNKVELELEFQTFLPFIREKLQNYSIEIKVVVNESEEKNFIYTPEEKYNRLKEINPLIDTLRKELDLEL